MASTKVEAVMEEEHYQWTGYGDSVKQIQNILTKYDLTANQSLVFVYLGKYGTKTAREIYQTLKLPRAETYHILTYLQTRGIVSSTFDHPTKFQALSLEDAISTLITTEKERIKDLEKQEGNLNELWAEIPLIGTEEEQVEDEQKFQLLKGANQINSKLTMMTDSYESEFLILGSEKDFLKFYHLDLLEPFVDSKKDFKILTGCSEKTMYFFDGVDTNNIKKLGKDIEASLCFVIKDNNEMIMFIKNNESNSQKISAMWTNSQSMIYSQKLLFESLWKKSKQIHL